MEEMNCFSAEIIGVFDEVDGWARKPQQMQSRSTLG
jgi:hypothetical protein